MNGSRFAWIAAFGLVLALAGCSSNSPTKSTTPAGPWDFPAANGKFAITLYTDQSSYAAGDSFDVKLVGYGLTNAFGAAFEVSYPPSLISVGRIVYNPTLFPDSTQVLRIQQTEPDSDRVSFGFTFTRGAGQSINGSAVLLRIRCLALGAGQASLAFTPGMVSIGKSDGSLIDNFSNLEEDPLTVTIH